MIELLRKYCKGDKYMWGAIVFLLLTSILSVYSSSTSMAYSHGTDIAILIFRHGLMLVGGLVVMVAFSNLSPKYVSGFSTLALIAGLIGVSLAILGFGATVNGSARWLKVGGFTIQPSELLKMALVVYVAKQLAINNSEPKRAFWPIIVAVGISCGCVMIENLSTCLLMAMTCGILMFIGRIPVSKLVMTGVVIAVFLTFIIISAPMLKDVPGLKRAMTWRARIERYIGISDSVGKSDDYQAEQALMAVSTGGLLGKGPGNSYMKNFLPMANSDFIFSIILEEYGIWGGFFIVISYLIIMARALLVSRQCEKAFHAYTLLGLGLLLTLQAMINMFVGVGLMPVTGQTLPMVSQGGSSNLLTGIALGIMLSITSCAEEASKAASQPATPNNVQAEETKEEDELYDEAEAVEL